MRACLLLLHLVLLLPAAASASTVRDVPAPCGPEEGKYQQCVRDLVLSGGPGEANRLTLTPVGDRTEIRDAGAAIADASGFCDPLPDGVSCRVPERGRVEAGDGDDVVVLDGVDRWIVRGGEGRDTITGSSSGELLDGGPGADVVEGGDGDDLLLGGDGDVLRGGEGLDLLSYRARTTPVRVDLAAGTAGTDTVAGVEAVEGGAGADVLLGGEEADELRAGPGDVADGRAGDDQLMGQGARLRGGPGSDLIVGTRGGNAVDCGGGRDTVSNPMATDVLARSCERALSAYGYAVRLGPGALAVSFDGSFTGAGTARLSVVVSGRRRVVGLRRLLPGVERAVRLDAVGRRLARRPGTLVARLELSRENGSALTIRLQL